MRDRAPSEVFHLPVEKIRSGYYSDQYFNRTRAIVSEMAQPPSVTMQVFQKNEAVLGGIDEAIAILRECAGQDKDSGRGGFFPEEPSLFDMQWQSGWDRMIVTALHEADPIEPFEPVLSITGPYALFAHLETVYLGVLARRTLIGTNVREVIRAANGKPIMYFPARHDHWGVQAGDGYTAHLAGVQGVSTDAQANWWGGKGMGTVPHALIAAFGGDTIKAAIAFASTYGHETDVSVLVDFDNDCARTALRVAMALKERNLPLWGVRLDTSGSMVDAGLFKRGLGQFTPVGVCPELVHLVRNTLDSHGFEDIKIIVSGGFTPTKIALFESQNVPVDAYGVGSSLLRGSNDFTADIVRVNGKPCAKVGRKLQNADQLDLVT